MTKREEGSKLYILKLVNKYLSILDEKLVVFSQPKGELVGPGKFVNQDTLVANAQGSSSLNYC